MTFKKWHKLNLGNTYAKGKTSSMKGKKHTSEAIEKNRLAHLGNPAWNKGLRYQPKDNGHRFRKGCQTWNKGIKGMHLSPSTEWQKGRKPNHSKETLMKISIAKTGKDRGEKFKKKMAIIHNEQWKNPEYAKRIRKAQGAKPNRDELYLDAILQLNFPNEWKYVGDGEIWIDGKNPDFINCNGTKIVIGYNGFKGKTKEGQAFGHTPEKDQAKTVHYAKYGFKTLNICPIGLKDEKELAEKIREFNAQ